jgi:hypothetical protein
MAKAVRIEASETYAWTRRTSDSPRRRTTTSSTAAATSSAPNAALPGCITTGGSTFHEPTNSQNAVPPAKTAERRRTPPRRQRITAYATANEATRYMLNMSRCPPIADCVACIAALPGPSRTTMQAMTVAR